MKKLIQEPLRNYYSFCRRVFSPFGVSPDKTKRGPCMELQKETDILLSRMMTEVPRTVKRSPLNLGNWFVHCGTPNI